MKRLIIDNVVNCEIGQHVFLKILKRNHLTITTNQYMISGLEVENRNGTKFNIFVNDSLINDLIIGDCYILRKELIYGRFFVKPIYNVSKQIKFNRS